MTGNRKLFSSYKAYNGGNVIFGSNLRSNIIGKDTILNDSLKIDNVEHVDNFRVNLLSVGQICDNKCRVTFSEHDSEITKDGKFLKLLDEVYSSKNYVRKFLRALHPKWRAKVTAIEESKDLSSLALDELIGNLKVHELVMEKDSEIYRGEKERIKSIALKAKKESSDDETLTSGNDDEEYAMAVRNFKKFFRIKDKFVRQPREEKKSS
ncbi:zf-CCHC domain-containing protein [Tanacetum coccineum]